MGGQQALEVDSWETALAIVRYVLPDAEVTVPKRAEPLLPEDLPLRRSNVPWSIHKGARRVYREDRPGAHVQIREYDDHWTVQRDRYNPHYRPVRHVALDTPVYTTEAITDPIGTTVDLLLYTPVRSLQLADQLTTDGVSTVASVLELGLAPLVRTGLPGDGEANGNRDADEDSGEGEEMHGDDGDVEITDADRAGDVSNEVGEAEVETEVEDTHEE